MSPRYLCPTGDKAQTDIAATVSVICDALKEFGVFTDGDELCEESDANPAIRLTLDLALRRYTNMSSIDSHPHM